MLFWDLLGEILMLIGLALFFGSLFNKIKQSPIIGYILSGILVSPLLSGNLAIQEISELGISLMLFSIGLEMSFNRIRQMGKFAIFGGLSQVIITILLTFLVLSIFMDTKQAVLIGFVVALSSTAIVIRTLMEKNELDSIHGRMCIGILLLQDLAMIPLIIIIGLMSEAIPQSELIVLIFRILFYILGIILSFYLIFYKLVPKILMTDTLNTNREFIALTALMLALGSAWITHHLELSPSLGAFIAGVLLAESPFSSQIRSDIGSLKIIFVTVFFVSIGMFVKVSWIIEYGLISLGVVLLCVAFKFAVTYSIAKMFKFDFTSSFLSSISLAQIGEFSFVFLTAAFYNNLINERLFAIMVTSNVLSLILTPYLINGGIVFRKKFLSLVIYKVEDMREVTPVEVEDAKLSPEVAVIGYGVVGKEVSKFLSGNGLRVKIIEFNPRLYNQARIDGFETFMGSASRIDILKNSGVLDAKAIVVSMADLSVVKNVISAIRILDDKVNIYARSRLDSGIISLRKLRVNFAVNEEMVTAREISSMLISELDSINNIDFAKSISGINPAEVDEQFENLEHTT